MPGAKPDGLIVVFLRGAADALNLVVPYGDPDYYALRPGLSIPHPEDSGAPPDERAIDLDGFFGLHPALEGLLPAWQAGHLALVHACGAPDDSRSHFQAQELMERGVASTDGPASGWLGRHLANHPARNPSPLRVVSWGSRPKRSLVGPVPVSTICSLESIQLGSDSRTSSVMRDVLATMYGGSAELDHTGRETLEILDTIQNLKLGAHKPESGLAYPDTAFGQGLRQLAVLIKAGVGLEVAAIDLDGWDTHFAQGVSQGLMANLVRELGQGLAAFYDDLLAEIAGLTVVVMTEFGRRAGENGSLGTDHGHGGLMMLLGGHVTGGMVHGTWPGLAADQLVGPGDLAVATDYRDVLGEICAKRLGSRALNLVFPDFSAESLGLVRGPLE